MKKTLLNFFFFFIGSYFISAQTIGVGDIAIIGYNTDSPDAFTWIALTDIPAGEIIYFTDEGWTNQTNNWVGTTEPHITWTSPAGGISCGTVININEPNNDNNLVVTGGGSVVNPGTWNLASGDQILAYYSPSGPEPSSAPTFLAGVHGDDGNGTPLTLNTTTKWNDLSATAGGTARSELPPGLTNGVNCVSLNPTIGTETDNYKYTGTLTGTSTILRGLINDRTNWSSDNSTPFNIDPSAYSPSVTCVAACSESDVPTVTYSPSTICSGNNATLSISGSLNDATNWHIYTGSCGGTQIGTTAGTTFVVTPSSPSTTYFVRGEGGCTTPGSCGAVSVNVTNLDDASFSYGSSSYCVNASDPTPTITGLTGGTFTSSPSGLSISASTGAIDVSASTPNTYTITYTTGGSCPNSSNVNVTVNGLDDASFSYGSSSYCVNASDPTPTITGLTGGTFTSSPSGLSISASTGAIDVSASTPNTYTITYITGGSCPNSSNINVTINTIKNETLNIDVCYNSSYTYADGTMSNNIIVNESHTSNLIGQAMNGCDSILNENLIVISEKRGIVDNTICNNESVVVNGVTYDASNSTGTEVFTNVGPNNCDSIVTINLNVLAAKTGVVDNTICNNESVVVNGVTYDASNSTGTEVFTNVGPNNCDSTVTINLNILAAKTGTITQTICFGDSIIVNGTVYNSTVTGAIETFSNIGVNNCDSVVTINLTVQPAIDITVNNLGGTLQANETGATYRWLDCDNGNGVIPSAANQDFTPLTSGNYAVEITVGSCTDTSACENVSTVGILNKLESSPSIYPNPTQGIITIEFNNNNITGYKVLSIDGRIIIEENTREKLIQIDLTKESKGVYFLQLIGQEVNKMHKLLKK